MVGVCFKHDESHLSLIRDEYYELLKAFPDIEVYERDVDIEVGSDYNGRSFTSITNGDDLPEGVTVVIISGQAAEYIQGTISLKDYVHPENVIYFLGDDHSHLTQADIGTITTHDVVYIPIATNVWSPQALSIILYDRIVKNG